MEISQKFCQKPNLKLQIGHCLFVVRSIGVQFSKVNEIFPVAVTSYHLKGSIRVVVGVWLSTGSGGLVVIL